MIGQVEEADFLGYAGKSSVDMAEPLLKLLETLPRLGTPLENASNEGYVCGVEGTRDSFRMQQASCQEWRGLKQGASGPGGLGPK